MTTRIDTALAWLLAHHRRVLVVILAGALLIRLATIALSPDYQPSFDSGDYVRHAQSIAAGDGFPESVFTASPSPSAFRPPLYPYTLGAVFAVFGSGDGGETTGRVLGALFGVLAVYLVFLVGAMMWKRPIGLIAAGLAAVLPPLAFLNAALITEPIFLAIELGVVLTALIARQRGGDWRWAAACGCLCGLAGLTRSNGILLAVPAAFGVWVARPRISRAGLGAPLAVIATAVLTIVPWTIRNTVEFDELVPFSTQSGFAMAGIYNDEARDFPGYPATWILPQQSRRYAALYTRHGLDEAELDDELRRSATTYALHHPGYAIEATLRNGLRTLELMGSPPGSILADERQLGLGRNAGRMVKASWFLLAALTLVGVLALFRRPRSERGPGFIWWMPALMLLAAVWLIASTRYRIPVYPYMALLSGVAVHDFGARLLQRRNGSAPAA